MLGFVQNFFAAKPSPIGIDLGTDQLRVAQVRQSGSEWIVTGAASATVPQEARNDTAARLAFFGESIRELVSNGNLVGRQVMLSLPAAWMHILHLRMPRLETEARKKALAWEVRGKLPIEPTHALLRHVVAGEVYQDGESRDEIIVMAARRELINQYLAAASKARLDVIGMNTEPMALLDCFTHLYSRKTDTYTVNCFIDIGASGSRAIVCNGGEILFARMIPVGGDHFTRAVADELKLSFEQAKELREKFCKPTTTNISTDQPERRAQTLEQVFGGEVSTDDEALSVGQACREPLDKLVGELELCRRYHEATFPNRAIERLVFVGGEARQRTLCQYIARAMGLAAQVGDPMVRMTVSAEVETSCEIDSSQQQPAWATAFGLSMGAVKKQADHKPAAKSTEPAVAEAVS